MIGGYMVYKAYKTPATYKATFTFMRDDDETNSMSSVASILGQFGFGGSRSRFNLDRVLELAKSRRIVHKTIFDRITLDGKEDYIGNFIIDIYELDQIWKERNPQLDGFRFTRDSIELFSMDELGALRKVYVFIIGGEDQEGLLGASYSEESSILKFSATTIQEQLSIKLIEKMYH